MENVFLTTARLSKEFIGIESTFNTVHSNLTAKKTELNTKYEEEISLLRSESNKVGLNSKEYLENGSFLSSVIDSFLQSRKQLKSLYKILYIIAPAIISLGTLYVRRFDITTLIILALIPFGIFFVLHKRITAEIEQIENVIDKAEKDVYPMALRTQLGNISSKLGEEIQHAAKLALAHTGPELEKKRESLKKRERDAHSKHTKALVDFETEEKSTLKHLNEDGESKLKEIKDEVRSLNTSLNTASETFDPSMVNWSEESISRGNTDVSSVFRVGSKEITIGFNGAKHTITLPVCLPFLNKSNVLMDCSGPDDLKKALDFSHNLISRVLVSLPPNKTKITFIDPLELGANAAPFTPLQREIYGGMVCTQQEDIIAQLKIVTRSIENVIQRYLQDKFEDIAAYNQIMKEVPEPYRLLVVYNFPHGFDSSSCQLLKNILKSGPKAGIHTILINDTKSKLPHGIDWKDFEQDNMVKVYLEGEPVRLSPSTKLSFGTSEKQSKLNPSGNNPNTENETTSLEVGHTYSGKIIEILTTQDAVTVEILPGKHGLLHVNDWQDEDVLCEGDIIDVKLMEIDKNTGGIKLSRRNQLESSNTTN